MYLLFLKECNRFQAIIAMDFFNSFYFLKIEKNEGSNCTLSEDTSYDSV